MNSYEMDLLYKEGEVSLNDFVGINKQELFKLKYFIKTVYPLPKTKYKYP